MFIEIKITATIFSNLNSGMIAPLFALGKMNC